MLLLLLSLDTKPSWGNNLAMVAATSAEATQHPTSSRRSPPWPQPTAIRFTNNNTLGPTVRCVIYLNV